MTIFCSVSAARLLVAVLVISRTMSGRTISHAAENAVHSSTIVSVGICSLRYGKKPLISSIFSLSEFLRRFSSGGCGLMALPLCFKIIIYIYII